MRLCEVDFVTALSLMRRRLGKGKGFDLSEFMGRKPVSVKESSSDQ